MPSRTSVFARRLVAARYQAADALHAGWSTPEWRARGAAFAVALAVVVGGQLVGLTERLDGAFRALLHPLAIRGGDVGAVVVTLDDVRDLEARDALLRAIRGGRPRVVVTLPSVGDAPVPLGLERGDRARCEGSLRTGLAALGLPCVPGALLAYAASDDATTFLRARAVREGAVPTSAFFEAVVVVADARSPTIATPRGPLSPADALAQVLATSASGRLPVELGPGAVLVAMLLLLLIALFAVSAPATRVRFTALVAVGCVCGSVGLFLVDVAFGPARPVLGTVALAVSLAALETRSAATRLGAVILRLEATGAHGIEQARHQAIARLARARLGARGAVVLDLPAGRWHLRVAAAEGCDVADVREVRRDCRRDPYREALRAGSVDVPRFFANASEAVLVPLAVDGLTLGFWALAFDGPPPDRALIEGLAREVAAGLLLAEYEVAASAGGQRFVSFAARLDLLDAAAVNLSARVRRSQKMLESLPVPLLVTGPWGTVEHANRAMRRLLARLGADAGERDLGRLVAAVAQLTLEEAERLLLRAQSGEVVTVAIATDRTAWSRLELAWSPGLDGAPGTFALSGVSLDAEALAQARSAGSDEPSRSGLLPHFGGRMSSPSVPPSRPPPGRRTNGA
jgi:hypothetical protein